MKRQILRLPVNVKLFNEKGEVVQSINSTRKTQILLRLRGVSRSEGKLRGLCRVWYNRELDMYNEFPFYNINQLKLGLAQCTEKSLIDYLKPDIPKKFLEKRTNSASSAMALKRYQFKKGVA